MSRLRLFLLGAPLIELDGAPITLNRRKDLALLAYLAVTAEPHTRETLATLLWPDYDSTHAFTNLRRSIWELNKTFGDRLGTKTGILTIRKNSDFWLDTEAFRSLIAESAQKDHLKSLQDAAALYRGDFLTGFNLRDSNAFEEWQFFTAAEYRRDFSNVLEELASAYVELGNFDQAVQTTQRWLELDTLHEPAQRKLIQLLALSGDRSAAIRQYRQIEKILARELGVEPDGETKRLLADIQSGKFDRQPISVKEDRRQIINLPIPPTPFVGRESALEQIKANLINPDCRLLSLLGPGGIGKTRLAIQTAQELADQFPQGVYFVPLTALNSRQSILQAIANALGFSFRPGNESAANQLKTYLQPKNVLLVLDNFEHLASEADLLNDIGQEAHGLQYLVTSRERLQLQMEWVFEVGGMEYPPLSRSYKSQIADTSDKVFNGETLLEYKAVQLFLSAAERIQVGFKLAEADYPAVARITQLVHGVPLALELAAAWITLFNPPQIADQIERSLDFLETSLQDIPERQRSLRAVFDQSWNLLDEREKLIVSSLSVFHGGFDIQAAENVFSISPQELLTLVSKSFLQSSESGRFELHELICQYAYEKFSENAQQTQVVLDQTSEYFCSWVNQLADRLKGPEQQMALFEFEQDLDNILCAWFWAVEAKKAIRISTSIEGLCLYFDLRIRFVEGQEHCRRGAEVFKEPESNEELLTLAQLLAWEGFFAQSLSDFDTADDLHQRSLDILDDVGSEECKLTFTKAFNLYCLGYVAHFKGKGEQAKQYLESSLTIFQTLGEPYWSADVLAALASTSAYLLWEKDSGEQYRTKSLEIRLSLGDQFKVANLQYECAVITAYHTGDLSGAEQLFLESSQIYDQLDSPNSKALALTCLGQIAYLNGKFEESIQFANDIIQIHEELGDRKSIAWVHIQLCQDYICLGDYQQAMNHSQIVFDHAQVRPMVDVEMALHHTMIGNLHLVHGEYNLARDLFLTEINKNREIHAKHSLARDLAGLGRAEYGLGDIESAWEHCIESLNLFSKFRHYDWMLSALATMALLLAHKGSAEKALELQGLVTCYPVLANSRWFEDVYWQEIKVLTKDLPQETIEKALSRGREANPWETLEQLIILLSHDE